MHLFSLYCAWILNLSLPGGKGATWPPGSAALMVNSALTSRFVATAISTAETTAMNAIAQVCFNKNSKNWAQFLDLI